MFSRIRTYTLSSFILLAALFLMTQSGFAQPYVCLPTCPVDARNFVFAGPDQSSFIENSFVFGISSPDDSPTFEFGIFDGDDGNDQGGLFNDWDFGGDATIRATLYADPMGEGAQIIQLGQWSGDGSFGDNTGNPMPDGEWFDIMLTNSEAARSANGSFRYTIVVNVLGVGVGVSNQFKMRTDGTMIILPFAEFAFVSLAQSFDDTFVIWPNLTDEDFNDPACYNNVTFQYTCNQLDPDCCLAGGPYDGTWKFFIDVPEGEGVFNVWDGDFDFGSSVQTPNGLDCMADGVDVDTDDWNTPPGVPDFAQNTLAMPQGVSPGNPFDNNCFNSFTWDPSITYNIITPLGGESFNNDNPSGNQEWELYNIGSVGLVDEPRPGDVPGGIWTMMVLGTDFSNLNGLRFDHPVVAVNEMGEPVPFDPMDEPSPVPTLNEWGLITLSVFVLLISVYYLRRQRRLA